MLDGRLQNPKKSSTVNLGGVIRSYGFAKQGRGKELVCNALDNYLSASELNP